MAPLLRDLVDFVELIHVELPDKGRQVLMPEEVGQHFVLQLLGILDQDLSAVIGPRDEIPVLVFLRLDSNLLLGCDGA